MDFLSVKSGRIVAGKKAILLRGVNLGGWLMMEGYILGGRNIPEKDFKAKLSKAQGKKALADFVGSFRDNFIREEDFQRIRRLGANCVRLPYNQRLIEDEEKPGKYDRAGLDCLRRAVGWCKKYGLYCILDLHAAIGCQNADWHADSRGEKLFWQNKKFRRRTVDVWRFLAEQFKAEPAVAGYDILNEPVCRGTKEIGALRDFYRQAIKAIRQVDQKHIILCEGNLWASDLSVLDKLKGRNIAISAHFYEPGEFVFNFRHDVSWPDPGSRYFGRPVDIQRRLKQLRRTAQRLKMPVLVGEFGVNWRGGAKGEGRWLKTVWDSFRKLGFHWTYWTYKAVNTATWPNGLYQYQANPPWINRQGPVIGWENFYQLWPRFKKEIIASWRTENFLLNQELAGILRQNQDS